MEGGGLVYTEKGRIDRASDKMQVVGGLIKGSALLGGGSGIAPI